MTATADLRWDVLDGIPLPSNIDLPAVNAATYYHGAMIADVAGVATKVTATAGLKIVGWCQNYKFVADTATVGKDSISVQCGVHGYAISSGDPVTAADQRTIVYAEGDNIIAKTSAGGTLSPAGMLIRVVGTVAYVAVGYFGGAASVVTKAGSGEIPLKLTDFREVSSGGDVGAIAAIGGVLASDTTPILRADAAESMEIAWAASNSDIIGIHTTLPSDFDGTGAVTVDLWVYGGTTDVATFTVETGWDAGALVTDTATDAVASATLRKLTATIAAADIPNTARLLSLYLTPAAHTTDATVLRGACINYKRS
jgi:hypothetical protein